MKMKPLILTLAASLPVATALAVDTNVLKSDVDQQSYTVGVQAGMQWKQNDVHLDPDMFLRGLKDARAGGTLLMTQEELGAAFNKFRQEMMTKQQEKQRIAQEKAKEQAEKNKTDGAAFLEANKTKPGVITLPNGLQYKVIAEGAGDSPKPEDQVSVRYRGTLIDGTEFDKSPADQPPRTFGASQVIKGWTEALIRMKKGAKWQLFIPSDLAYGEAGRPGIPGNSVLLFDVELVSFDTPPPPPPAPTPQPLTSDIIKVPSLEEMKKGAKIETIKAEDVDKLQKQAAEEQKKKDEEKK